MSTFVIGTAGHVDHGKTTLVHALTGVATDRLPEEKRRGISIELGFAPLLLPDGSTASLVDVPGHRRFVPTMIAGASGIDLVVLVVAADEGVMPQTREHVAVCELLGCKRWIVALTKIDRVDDVTRTLAEEEVRVLLRGTLGADAPIVPCAPPANVGLDALRDAIADALGSCPPRAQDRPPRLWVDRVLRVRGAGTVLTGTLVEGSIARGDRLVLATPCGVRPFVVRDLEIHGTRVARANASTRLAIAVNLDVDDVARGDLVTAEDAAPEPTTRIDASVRGAPLRHGERVTLHVGTSSAPARIVRCEPLGDPDEHAQLVRLALDAPRPIAGGDRHLLRGSHVSGPSGALVGGGVVLDARPDVRARRASRRALAAALHDRDAARALSVLLDRVDPRPVDPSRPSLAVSGADLAFAADRAVARGELVRCGPGVVRRASIARLAGEARRLVSDHVTTAPLDRGMPLAALRAALARRAGPDAAAAAILAARARTGPEDVDAIAIDRDVVVLAAREGRLPREIADHLSAARALVREAGVHAVSTARVAEILGVEVGRARAVLAALERDGTAVRVGDLWFARAVVEHVRARVVGHLTSRERIHVAQVKELCALPRRHAILLLEHLDAQGVTRRVGDARVLAGAPSS